MNYIVSWIIVKMMMTGCPDTPKPNEFGVIQNSNISCAAMHFRDEKFPNEKIFESKKQAYVFLEKLKEYSKFEESKNSLSFNAVKVESIKIDSVTVNK